MRTDDEADNNIDDDMALIDPSHNHPALQGKEKKRLDVAVVGLPNAGKSLLLNNLTGQPVAAVSRKRHTTREGLLGARTVITPTTATQLLFIDTPGFLRVEDAKREGLDRQVMTGAFSEMKYVDFSLVVVDAARRLKPDVKESLNELMMQALESEGRLEYRESDDNENEETAAPVARPKFAVVLNKVDLVHPKSDLLDIAMEIGEMADVCVSNQRKKELIAAEHDELDPDQLEELLPTYFYVSSLRNDGVDDVLNFLLDMATPCESWELGPEETTSMTPEERVEEVIREKIYRGLHKEVPYNVRQKNRLFRVVKGQQPGQLGLVIHQELMVRTKSHKELLHGYGNQRLEHIRNAAVRDLVKILGCPIELHLHVKLVKSRQREWSI